MLESRLFDGKRMTRGRFALPFVVCALLFVFVRSKTIRSRLYTNENGTRELVLNDGSDANDEDVKLLLETLNLLNGTSPPPEETLQGGGSEKTSESILMKHWNSLTEVGWKNYGQSAKKLYRGVGNGNKIQMKHPDEMREEEDREILNSQKDLAETRYNEVDLSDMESGKSPGDVEADNRLESDVGKSSSKPTPRTFLRPRRLLHKVLLPLLVLLVIKYLVTLPFVAVSSFTLNSMWLGLLSLAAVLINKYKHPERVYHRVPVRKWTHGPEVYDVSHGPTEIVWGPIRVPVSPGSVDRMVDQ